MERQRITFDRQTFDAAIRRHHADLTRHVLQGITGELPRYADLPTEAIEDDLTAAVDRAIRLYLTVLADDREPTVEELTAIADSAAKRADEGFTVDLVLDAYLFGVQLVMERLADLADTQDLGLGPPGSAHGADAMRAAARSLAFLRTISGTLLRQAGGDTMAVRDLRMQTDHELLLALLGGRVDDALLERAGRHLPAAHTVVRFAIAVHPDEQRPGTAGSIATRRKLRRLRDVLLEGITPDALVSVSTGGGVLVIPDDITRNDDELRTLLTPTLAALRDAAGAGLHATATSVPSGQTAAAAGLTAEVLELVLRLERPEGLHLLDDLAHEYQLTRPGPARRQLASVLDPLAAHPELLGTLRRYLATDGNRRRTALDLGVHPNTVDHRIRRITGVLTVPFDPVRLSACLLALDAERADETADPPGIGDR